MNSLVASWASEGAYFTAYRAAATVTATVGWPIMVGLICLRLVTSETELASTARVGCQRLPTGRVPARTAIPEWLRSTCGAVLEGSGVRF
jgi:hypothetical protein